MTPRAVACWPVWVPSLSPTLAAWGRTPGPPTDEVILAWWNRVRGDDAEVITPEMVQAYMRRAARLGQLDAHLARLLTASEWAEVAARLPPAAPPSQAPALLAWS
jgi:hypothetical protein